MNQDRTSREAFGWSVGIPCQDFGRSELVHAINEALLARSYITPLMTKDMVWIIHSNFNAGRLATN